LLIEEKNEIAGVVLDSVDPVGVTEVLESRSQPLSSEELYDGPTVDCTAEGREDHGTKEEPY
jgi:hypothetical protein